MAARGGNYSGCYRSLLSEVAGLHFCPELEKIAIHHLADPDAAVVKDAAKMLGKHGSAAAEKYLWARLKLWHQHWKPRAAELKRDNPWIEPYDLEMADKKSVGQELATALATGMGWLADKHKLEKIKNLCLTDWAVKEIERMINIWSRDLYIRCYPLGEVAQYHFFSLDELKAKLAQFPRGTLFQYLPSAPPGGEARGEQVFSIIKAFVEKRGMKLKRSPD